MQSSASRESIVTALLVEDADFAICTPPINHKDIETQLLFTDTALVLLPEGHPLKEKNRLLLTDLDRENFIITPIGYGMRDNVDIVFAGQGVAPHIVIETADSSLMPAYVREGIGFAMIPKTVVLNNQTLHKECREIYKLDYQAHVSLSWKKNRHKSINHQLLIDFMKAYYA